MKYTQIPTDTFRTLQMNAGILATNFNPETGEFSGQIGATSGGIQFTDEISFTDLGEDIDNCPKNMKELKEIDQREVTMSGTFVTLKAATAKMTAIADIDGRKIVPRNDLKDEDFGDIWFIGDYSDKNTGESAGFLAIKLINALSTGGFSLQTGDKEKGQFSFTFTGHYSMAEQDRVPYEIYIQSDEAITPSIKISPTTLTVPVWGTAQVSAVTIPADAVVNWSSSDESVATIDESGVITIYAVEPASCVIIGRITVDGVQYADTMTLIVEKAAT